MWDVDFFFRTKTRRVIIVVLITVEIYYFVWLDVLSSFSEISSMNLTEPSFGNSPKDLTFLSAK